MPGHERDEVTRGRSTDQGQGSSGGKRRAECSAGCVTAACRTSKERGLAGSAVGAAQRGLRSGEAAGEERRPKQSPEEGLHLTIKM